MNKPFPFVSVEGDVRTRGHKYGQAVPERIARSAAHYRSELEKIGADDARQRTLINEAAEEIARFDPDQVAAIEGIAQGAGVSIDDIVLINARTEVIAKARQLARQEIIDPAEGECTTAVILPNRSATGTLIHAHNWDWTPDASETTVILRETTEAGLTYLTFVEAGGLARYGLNSAGVTLTGNYLSSDRDYCQAGVPLSCIRRKALEQEHLAVAMQVVAASPKSCSSNMILTQKGWAIDFECVPDESFPLMPVDDLLTHANHFESPVALGKVREMGLRNAVDTYYRSSRMRSLLEQSGEKISVDDAKRILADDWATPYSICRPVREALSGGQTATVASIVMDPEERTMDVATMPSQGVRYVRYSMDRDPQPL
ncbi:C45 family peptidase [Tropicimonas sp. IMCC34011]|uniref:C45 family autoproteolytic acyltransferase/hydolase n=1 Tax=Tropicimonas sp. IMCC34011 TaxID=2248759 RepID=UPI000E24D96E|nr:C45 family peptidase [Tropicimonas sp. IMCC34011]